MRDLYFDWLYSLAMNGNEEYKYLCAYLHGRDFVYILPMDDNRFEDGISLRYRFGREQGFPNSAVARELDTRPCSVLEMMVALALRIEEEIMSEEDLGDRTSEWFARMLYSLDLLEMTDRRFDESVAERAINNFLNRNYRRDGKGGLFTICDRPDRDMRNVEIWYQAMWYLNNIVKGEIHDRESRYS